MSLIKSYLHTQMFHQNLKTMNEEQLSKVKDNYAQLILDNMDYKDMERLLFDVVRSDMETANEEELRAEIVDFYGDDQWEQFTN